MVWLGFGFDRTEGSTMTSPKFNPHLGGDEYAKLTPEQQRLWYRQLIEFWGGKGGDDGLQWDYEKCGTKQNYEWGE